MLLLYVRYKIFNIPVMDFCANFVTYMYIMCNKLSGWTPIISSFKKSNDYKNEKVMIFRYYPCECLSDNMLVVFRYFFHDSNLLTSQPISLTRW